MRKMDFGADAVQHVHDRVRREYEAVCPLGTDGDATMVVVTGGRARGSARLRRGCYYGPWSPR